MDIPRVRIAHLPTPVEPLPCLSEALGGPRLFVKRDDQTGLAFGGNKTRKLELLIADARSKGARTLITGGAAQSNHCRQTAAAAARFGLDCVLVLTGDEPPRATGNLLLDHLFRAELIWAGEAPRDEVMARANEMAEKKGDAPYLVPYGGSSPTGAAAYTLALEELLKQGYHPDWILLASSSGGTQAGLMAGQRRFGFRGKIMGISIDEPREALSDRVTELATETGDLVGGDPFHIASGEVLVNDDYLGGGYGVVGDAEREAIHLFASMEGMLLDPVYTGRAAAGLIDLIRKKRFNPEETVLFWHTGGTPALFAERYAGIHVRPGGTRVEGPSQG